MRYEFNDKIIIIGNPREMIVAKRILNSIDKDVLKIESKSRLEIQKLIDNKKFKGTIMYDGNSIWSYDRIIRNIEKIKKKGILGYAGYVSIGNMLRVPEYTEMRKPILSDYLYQFLSLSCGSIAHFNKAGWIAEYPTSKDLKEFFQRNEFGQRIYDYIPEWKTDAKRIVGEAERILK